VCLFSESTIPKAVSLVDFTKGFPDTKWQKQELWRFEDVRAVNKKYAFF
jgi:hypothetical protein